MNRNDDDLGTLLRETFADAEQLVTDDTRPDAPPRRSRLMILSAAASVAVITVVGVTLARTGPADEPVGSGTTTATAPAGTTSPDLGRPTSRGQADLPAGAAQIYAAVLRSEFTRENLNWQVLWVLDAPHSGVSPLDKGPMRRGAPFDQATRTAIERALADLGPVRWVPDAAAAHTGGDCSPVRDKGVILTLGDIRRVGQHVEVGASSWFGCLGAHWGTYRLDGTPAGGWRVTGTVGPEAVA